MKSSLLIPMLVSLLGCAGGGISLAPPPSNYTIGGTVISLVGGGGGLQLQDNNGDNLLVNASGTFTFPMALPSGDTYSVTVSVQPSSPLQKCEVTHGTATVNITTVAVDCGHAEWTWVGGANIAGQSGTYGIQGAPSPGNVPSGRSSASVWIDGNRNFWVFGGQVGDNSIDINDLWEYRAGQWTWTSGSKMSNQSGTYGSIGIAAPDNFPGARLGAVNWTDRAGNLWLFGGYGFDSTGGLGFLNDLWEFTGEQWSWVGGSSVANQSGRYGSQGAASSNNIPGARLYSASWTDATGNFWLFGGQGYDANGRLDYLNDLWVFSSGQWKWMSGASVVDQNGSYGIQGTASPTNVPRSRNGAAAWTDAAGNLWMFGGGGYDSLPPPSLPSFLGDLWKYSAGQWTWVGGSNIVESKGVYGTQGMPAPGNIPGARVSASSWTDQAGNLWLFGGAGYTTTRGGGPLNDLWEYSAGEWTWMGGSNAIYNQVGIYGTQGTPAPTNTPGARVNAVSWTDPTGNLWLFSGTGNDSVNGGGLLNDLWRYEP